MKKLGIIGGMGSQATQLFYKSIIEKTDAKCDQEHIDMIILNHASMPDRTASILSGETEEILKLLTEDAKMLENCGATAIAIPCNTSHYFWEDIQKSVNIPVINMVRETIGYIKERNPEIKKIGVLATDGTVKSGIYKKECEALDTECVTPSEDIQKLVTKIIYDQVKKGEEGSMEDFRKIDHYMKSEGCEVLIMACTELSCFKYYHNLGGYYVDAMDVLTEKSIISCGGKLK